MSLFDRLLGRRISGGNRLAPPRMRHYQFAHKALPQEFFQSSAAVLSRLEPPADSLWLAEKWNSIGRQAGEESVPVSSEGLAVTHHEIAGGRWPVIAFPAPTATVEAFFAVMLREAAPDAKYRYLILERTEDSTPDRPMGVLCEWFADGSRRNHETLVAGSKDAFLMAVAEQRQREGASFAESPFAKNEIVLNPLDLAFLSEEDMDVDALFDRPATYRLPHCLFAFEVVPSQSAASLADWIVEIENGRADALQESLWEMTSELCRQRSVPPIHAAGLKMEVLAVRQEKGVLITMPPPAGAPEPYFLFLPAPTGAEDTARRRFSAPVYSFEMPSGDVAGSFLLCHLTADGTHSVGALVTGAGRENCFAVLERIAAGHTSAGKPTLPILLGQLTLYAQVDSVGKKQNDA